MFVHGKCLADGKQFNSILHFFQKTFEASPVRLAHSYFSRWIRCLILRIKQTMNETLKCVRINIHIMITEFLFHRFHDIESVSLSRAFENKATIDSIEFCVCVYFIIYLFFLHVYLFMNRMGVWTASSSTWHRHSNYVTFIFFEKKKIRNK